MKLLTFLFLFWAIVPSLGGITGPHRLEQKDLLQDIVSWDEHSLFVRGERILFYSGEVHPFRLPVPSLWLDIFQKIRAAGFTGVSFYIDWALLEGQEGYFRAHGVFDLNPFFESAKKAGVYLLARPGPYINAEVSGGGFPGWLQKVQGRLRTSDEEFLNATDFYVEEISKLIAPHQITNGGPVILLQPENEYSTATENVEFPDSKYMGYVENQYRNGGIVVPFISNDAFPAGHNAPGTPTAIDIYGHDGYPLGFDCSNPDTWKPNALPTDWAELHKQQSPSTPYAIIEFQGGSFDSWGGSGFEKCAALTDAEFVRVFYKNLYSFGVKIFNIYMVFGGTNWGNLGHPGGYTSYDYGAAIAEDRTVTREKYSEIKLQANFLTVSPAYLTAVPQPYSNSKYGPAELGVTPIRDNVTQFYVVRHHNYASTDSISYKLKIPDSSIGPISIPQLSGTLSLNEHDSKIHVVDYDLGGTNLIYSSAEIFTWQKYSLKTVLVVYGGPGEVHEMAISGYFNATGPEGVTIQRKDGTTILNWKTSSEDQVVQLGNLQIFLLDRNSAYNFWTLAMPAGNEVNTPYTGTADSTAIFKAGYLMRTARVSGSTMALTGDINATTTLQIIGGAPKLSTLTFNGEPLNFTQSADMGVYDAELTYTKPTITTPDLIARDWRVIDAMPELDPKYEDAEFLFSEANVIGTYNTEHKLKTPVSLFAADYGYYSGYLLYRGHFIGNGSEGTAITLRTRGGAGFAMSAWLGNYFLGSFRGEGGIDAANSTFVLPPITPQYEYVLSVLIDQTGLDENRVVGSETMKNPRGIIDFEVAGRDKYDIYWWFTGNVGGEDYADRTRGPLNDGALFPERGGLHLPEPPVVQPVILGEGGPVSGISGPGVGWFTTSFDLDMPRGWDVPLSINFEKTRGQAFRLQLYVNGWQFGKYTNDLGPQTRFPIPEGILDYHGKNWLSLSFWNLDDQIAYVEDWWIGVGTPVRTGMEPVELVYSPKWPGPDKDPNPDAIRPTPAGEIVERYRKSGAVGNSTFTLGRNVFGRKRVRRE